MFLNFELVMKRKTWKIGLFLFWALAPSILKAQQSDAVTFEAKIQINLKKKEKQSFHSYLRQKLSDPGKMKCFWEIHFCQITLGFFANFSK
jgi:hypothetical protein